MSEIGGEHRQLVDQGDVHMAEGVLEQLGQLGLPGARHGDGPLHDPVVEALHRLASEASSMPETTFGVFSRLPRRGCRGRCARGCSRGGSRARRPAPTPPRGSVRPAPRWCRGRSSTRARPWQPGAGARRPWPPPPRRRRGWGPLLQRGRDVDHGDVEAGAGVGIVRRLVAPGARAAAAAARR